jgi:ankyrin repeat protein
MKNPYKTLILTVLLLLIVIPLAAEDIFTSVRNGDIKKIKSILEKDPGLVNSRDDKDRTPLIQAIFSRQVAVAKLLLEKNADFNLTSKDGFTPLHFAVFTSSKDIVEMLVAKGARLNDKSNSISATPLDLAVNGGYKEIIELLVSKGATVDAKDGNGYTALMKAVMSGRADIVQVLVSKGASLAETDDTGSTPLLLAALTGQKVLAEWLVEKGSDIHAVNMLGGSPVSVAAREGHQEVVDMLIAKGAKQESIAEPVLEGDYLGQKAPGLVPERFAPGVISTEKYELNSVFSADGQEFYYAVQTGPMNWKIMVAKRQDNRWAKAVPAPFSGQYSDVDMAFSADGSKLYFCSNRPLEENGSAKKDFDIWMVERSGGDWSKPRHAGAVINSKESEFYPSFAKDGTLYFQSTRPDSRGEKDIYLAHPVDGDYKKIENAGDAVNSDLSEGDALISPDQDFLILSVEKPDGFGQGDLYISFKDQDGGWTAPKSMGDQVNSKYHENCPTLSPDGKFLFFTRNHDIFWVDAAIIENLRGN